MININNFKVPIDDLKTKCSLDDFNFNTTEDLKPLKGIIGQERAAYAMDFGLKMKKRGYNIYVAGLSGTGRTSYTYSLIEKIAKYKRNNKDFVYVYNFKIPNEPIALSFEAGQGKEFKKDVEEIVEKLKEEIPKNFESKEYEEKNAYIVAQYEQMTQNVITELNEFAKERGFTFQVTQRGLVSIPLKENKTPMLDEEYKSLSQQELNTIREKANELNKDITDYVNKIKGLEEEFKNKILELDKKIGENIVDFYINYLIDKYGYNEKILTYLHDMKEDIVENISKFKKNENEEKNMFAFMQKDDSKFFLRYKVNLFIDNSELKGARIVNETNPTYYNLTGMIEYKNEIGVLTTSYLELKPGAIHKANGGFLILNVKDLFSHPFAWQALKRALKTGKVTMETLNKQYGYIVTSTLKPEPIDIEVKVILIGDSYTYSFLYAYDEDFRKLFKIMADFDIEINRNEENLYKIARFIATHCEKEGLKHFDKGAIEKVIEYSSRICENKEKLSARFNQIVDILYEADALSDENSKYVTRVDVQKAIDGKKYRNNKYEEKLNEMFKDGTLIIDIEGEKVGQINGLAVMGTGEYSFGKPSRITASTYKGKKGIINIEREVKRSGSSHDKGVLILSGYLGGKYGRERPLSLTTSITFEQNYSGIDGDSASSTELYVIISSIANVPIKQYIAVTGSVSQKGEIQPIGGVNEKIEGFFDVCKLKGLTGKQGVMIPKQNVKNLMLKDEIIEAVKEGKFHIYSIGHIEEGLEILTGLSMKEIDEKVNKSLEKLAEDDEKDDKKDN
ncbi:Lon protease family protein [Tepidibacter formicigenes]|jgi:lon-related putative ATP-dependent protease|uniref:endopeptidase La n=1 Tax=Tepidibacter formicigenes DSM 15518 TaxID=1123349 RepID=A0A1M6SYZ9_9FIRM|nr:ATP-binding protein [Tepidibacter formicigenes]SHK49982.1 lon-related putative ATP-dependent protease [Tepidibacter formicigenes DSM 15518]